MLENLQCEDRVIGMKQSIKAIEQDDVKTVYLAQDIDQHLQKRLEDSIGDKPLEVIYIESRKKLGKACGIDVGATVVAVLK